MLDLNPTTSKILIAVALLASVGYGVMLFTADKAPLATMPPILAASQAPSTIPLEPIPIEQHRVAVLVPPVVSNPLLTATRDQVGRWFPGSCFAEIYTAEPSFGGKLIAGCVTKTTARIKDETGYALTQAEFRSPAVLSHLKTVYGASIPWRQ